MAIFQAVFSNVRIPTTLLVLATLAFTVQCGDAIMCWECNSHYDKNCADPFRNNTFALTDCGMRQLEHYPDKKASVCRKIIQKVKDDYRFIRGCGWLSSEKESTDCIKRAGTFNVLIQYCSCSGDGCNGSQSLLRASSGWAIKLLLYPAITLLASVAVK